MDFWNKLIRFAVFHQLIIPIAMAWAIGNAAKTMLKHFGAL
jgi:hypothetical protein